MRRGIFARLGYAATTVEEIAKEAGIAEHHLPLLQIERRSIRRRALGRSPEFLTNRMIESMSAAGTFEERLTVFLDQNWVNFRQPSSGQYLRRGLRKPRFGFAARFEENRQTVLPSLWIHA